MSSAQRIAVWEGRKEKTSGGLKKSDLIKNRQGRIVSKKKSAVAKRLNNLGSHLRGKKAEPKKAEPKKAAKKAAKKTANKTAKKTAKKKVEEEDYVDDQVREKKRKKPKKGYASGDVDPANIVVGKRRRRKPRGGAMDLKTVLEKAAEVKPKPKRTRRLKSKKLIVQL